MFLLSIANVIGQTNTDSVEELDTDIELIEEISSINNVDRCIEFVNKKRPNIANDKVKRWCNKEIKSGTKNIKQVRKLDKSRLKKIKGLSAKKQKSLLDMNPERRAKLASLSDEKLAMVAKLDKTKVRKLAKISNEKIARIAKLDENQLKKLASMDRVRLKKLSGMNEESMKKELEKYQLKAVVKKDFKKRTVAKSNLKMVNQEFLKKVTLYKNMKANFKNERTAFQEAKESGDEEAAKEHAKKFLSHAADMTITTLEKVRLKAETSESMSEDEVAETISKINEKINELETSKKKVLAATSKEEIKDAGKIIINAWKRAKHMIKLHAVKVVKSKVSTILAKSEKLERRLEHFLAKAEEKGVDTSSLDEQVDSFSETIDEARTKFKEAEAYLKEAKDAEDDSKKELLEEARSLTKEAYGLLKDAHKILAEIVKSVKGTGEDFNVDKEINSEETEAYEIIEVASVETVETVEKIEVDKSEADTTVVA